MSSKKIRDIQIKEIQGTVLTMRQNAPSIVSQAMNAYKESIETELVRSKLCSCCDRAQKQDLKLNVSLNSILENDEIQRKQHTDIRPEKPEQTQHHGRAERVESETAKGSYGKGEDHFNTKIFNQQVNILTFFLKQIQLNTRTDNLLKALEYLKK